MVFWTPCGLTLVSFALAAGLGNATGINGTWKLSYPPWNEPGSPMQGKTELFIPIMGPVTGHGCMPSRYFALRIAASHLNRRDSSFCPAIGQLRHDFEVKYELRDSHASGSGAVLAAIKLMEADNLAGRTVGDQNAKVKVLLGPNSSPEVAGLYPFLGSAFSIPYLSWAATRGSLGDKAEYPYFFRVVAPDSVTMGVQAGFISWLGYRRVNILHMEDSYATGQAGDFTSAAAIIYNLKVEKSSLPQAGSGAGSTLDAAARALARSALIAIRNSNVRVIGLYAISAEIRDIFLIADELGMARGHGWLWFGGDGMAGTMFTGNATEDTKLLSIMEGAVYAVADNPSPWWSGFQSAWRADVPSMDEPEFTSMNTCHGGTVCQGRSDFSGLDRTGTRCLNSWLQEAYVAMVTMAVVADRIMDLTGKVPSDFTKEEWYAGLKTLITQPFDCLSGTMQLSDRQERASAVSFFQLQQGGTSPSAIAATWKASAGYGWVPNQPLKWADGSGYTPTTRDANVTVPSGRPPPCPDGEAYDQQLLRCEPCPTGYTPFMLDGVPVCTCDAGYGMDPVAGVCLPCEPGMAKAQPGNQACSACPPGEASAGSAATSCQLCALGLFASAAGQASCTPCGEGYTTATLGAANRTDCICALDYYVRQGRCERCPSGAMTTAAGATELKDCLCPRGTYRPKENPEACEACMEGMTCETEVARRFFGSVERGGLTARNVSMEPVLNPSYWSSAEDTLLVFRCASKERCPGGLPGDATACAPLLEGRACGHCIPGWVWSDTECIECSSFERISYLLPIIFGPLLVIGLYKISGDGYDKWNNASKGCAAVVFILLNHFQIVTTLRGSDINLPENVKTSWNSIAWFCNVSNFLNMQCVGVRSFGDLLMVNTLGPAGVIAMFCVTYGGSVLIGWSMKRPDLEMHFDRVLNCCLSLLFTFFQAIIEMAFTLFTCGLNTSENDVTTLIADRSVVCFSDEWNGMLGWGVGAVLIWVCGFGGLLVRTVICAPRWFHDPDMQMRYKFLFVKYRSDVHWWALVWIAKGIITNLGFTFLRAGIAQVHWVMHTVLVYILGSVIFMPWRHINVNYSDIFAHLCVIVICAALTWFAGKMFVDPRELDRVMGWTIVSFNVLSVPVGIFSVGLLFWRERALRNGVRTAKTETLRVALRAVADAPEDDFTEFVNNLSDWDFNFLMSAKLVLVQEFMGYKIRPGICRNQLTQFSHASSLVKKVTMSPRGSPGGDSVPVAGMLIEADPAGEEKTPRDSVIPVEPRAMTFPALRAQINRGPRGTPREAEGDEPPEPPETEGNVGVNVVRVAA